MLSNFFLSKPGESPAHLQVWWNGLRDDQTSWRRPLGVVLDHEVVWRPGPVRLLRCRLRGQRRATVSRQRRHDDAVLECDLSIGYLQRLEELRGLPLAQVCITHLGCDLDLYHGPAQQSVSVDRWLDSSYGLPSHEPHIDSTASSRRTLPVDICNLEWVTTIFVEYVQRMARSEIYSTACRTNSRARRTGGHRSTLIPVTWMAGDYARLLGGSPEKSLAHFFENKCWPLIGLRISEHENAQTMLPRHSEKELCQISCLRHGVGVWSGPEAQRRGT